MQQYTIGKAAQYPSVFIADSEDSLRDRFLPEKCKHNRDNNSAVIMIDVFVVLNEARLPG